jgi:oxaloacetate decarboxylase beta subunit
MLLNVAHRKFATLLICSALAVLGCGATAIAADAAQAAVKPASTAAASGETSAAESTSKLYRLWASTGVKGFFERSAPVVNDEGVAMPGQHGLLKLVMILVGLLLIYLGVAKGFEPLLLIPIGFGGILANIPNAGIAEPGGFLYAFYSFGIGDVPIFPLLIFLGVGAMTDFGPLLANPKTALLGAAAQFGIFATLIGAIALSQFIPGMQFDLKEASAISIIGGADGPTAIFLASMLSPHLLGAIAVAAYSYMALVPIIQPPIMKALTNEEERKIVMTQLRPVSKAERICFPLVVLVLCILLLPSATPLVGMLMLGNLFKECGVVERLSRTASNELINIVTIMLGLAVGSKLQADKFLSTETLGIIVLGLIAFCIGTASGVLMAKVMNKFARTDADRINPLIGSAGVSAVPMAARVSNKVGMEANPSNYLLMHAMGPNVAGVIGSAVAAGVLLALVG